MSKEGKKSPKIKLIRLNKICLSKKEKEEKMSNDENNSNIQ